MKWYEHNRALGKTKPETFNERWIGCRGQLLWPARLPGLNPLDYFV